MPTPTISPTMKLAYAYLKGMEARSEVHPGTADMVIGQFAGKGNPGQTLRAAVEFMASPAAWQRFHNPEHVPGPSMMPVRAVLRRLAAGGAIKDGSADELAARWALDMGGGQAGTVAERVGRRLELPENFAHLTEPPPESPGLKAVRDVLSYFRDAGQVGDRVPLDRIAADLDRRFGAGQGELHEVARKVADQIRAQPLLQPEGGAKFDPLDPIFHPGGVAPPQGPTARVASV